MSKQTAVEWLVEKLMKGEFINSSDELIAQAKQMEKEQIIDSFCVGAHYNSTSLIGYHSIAEQYYNETYNSKQ